MTAKTKVDFESNVRMVHYICKKYDLDVVNKINGYTYDDLFQIGCIGLWKAVQNFNESLGFKFSTYAFPKIKGEINRSLRDNRLIKSPRDDKDKIYALYKMYGHFWADVPIETLAESLGTTNNKICELLELNRGVTSLNKTVYYTKSNGDSQGEELIHLISDESSLKSNIEDVDFINSVLDILQHREREIFKLYYIKEWNQQEIADKIGVSQVQVSRLIKKIKNKLNTLKDIAS